MTVIKLGKEEHFSGIASINNLHSHVSENLILATKRTSELLRRAGVRHVLAGGVAVSCNGYSRTTSNIDWAVGKSAFEFREQGIFLRPELPVKFAGVPVHYLAPTDPFEQMMLEQYLVIPLSGEVPVLQFGPLTVMKLIGRRHKDCADLIELFKRRLSELPALKAFVKSNLPSQADMLDDLIACAESELATEGLP